MDWQACAALVEKGDPARFRAVMAAPVAARARLFPIYAFTLEVARAPWLTRESMIAEMRLQWWHDALDEIAAGGVIRRHEVVTPLALVLEEAVDTPALAAQLQGACSARLWDIYTDPFDTDAARADYISKTYVDPVVVSAALCELEPQHIDVARDIAFAGGLARFLAAVPALEAQGRQPVEGLALERIAQMAGDALAKARAGAVLIGAQSRSARAPLIDAMMLLPTLKLIATDPERVPAGALPDRPIRDGLRLAALAQAPSWAFA
ncbi:Squalene/phytoene synthase [Aquimixticola soesokkakensis]|uniref:Squalene/phytoene synthase n=1 Tax=Aquimixticola soesokkakensis TaxID=1519096 RepID=A0A1Y5SJJ2_9RHOB|nr:squalene/phytoene synthase family protein [Aquimixticola soesokkakensis]SLN42296.1 Squalene/phytoene synthase [Aquimixticola soesokkakensis]